MNIKALALLFVMLIFRIIVTISTQLAGGKTNIFQQNSLRYGATFLLANVMLLFSRNTLWFDKKHIPTMVATALLNFASSSSVFFATSFMPLGNIEAMYIGLYIIMSTIVDLIHQDIKLQSALASSITIVGLICLAQPWSQLLERLEVEKLPCEYWQDGKYGNLTNRSASYEETKISNSTSEDTQRPYFIVIDGQKHYIKVDPRLVGYIIICYAAFLSTFRGIFAKKLRKEFEMDTLAFWLAIIEIISAVAVTVIWALANGVMPFTFSSEPLCLGILLLFPFGGAVTYFLWIYSIGMFNVSKMALSNCTILISVYILQRTVLKKFHPGAENVSEVFGVVLVLCSLLVILLIELRSILRNKRNVTDQVEEES